VLIVLAGTPSLRTPAGSQTLSTGDVIRFPTGEQGAHQVWNEDEELVHLLAVSTHGSPDVVIYPDSNKLSAAAARVRRAQALLPDRRRGRLLGGRAGLRCGRRPAPWRGEQVDRRDASLKVEPVEAPSQ